MRELQGCRRHGSQLASVRVLRRTQKEAPKISVRGWTAFRACSPESHAEVQGLCVRPVAALVGARERLGLPGGSRRGGCEGREEEEAEDCKENHPGKVEEQRKGSFLYISPQLTEAVIKLIWESLPPPSGK